ncbi:MAG: hypothetical protein OEY31_05090 [Candidatus Bathyarchaeota archaeon]|nr:hypothetical protein [Candidatus Bathyarchaeota archaeon]
MGKGLSKQQGKILELLKQHAQTTPRFPWMSTRKIVMILHPEVEAYLAEERRYARWVHRNMMSEEVHERYREHLKKLKTLPNYHTARTSVNRALRGLLRRGLVGRQPWWGMYQRQGVSAGWLLPEYMSDSLKASPEYLELLRKAYAEGDQAHVDTP